GPRGAGALRVTLTLDPDNLIHENDFGAESNNTASADISSALPPYADLQVSGITLTPAADWQPGGSVQVNWTTTNGGQPPAAGNWIERLEVYNLTTSTLISSTDLAQGGTGALAVNASQTRSVTVPWPSNANAFGQLRFRVILDSGNTLYEYV